MIEEVIRKINEAENSQNVTVEEKIKGIDSVMAENLEVWGLERYSPNREAERQSERELFTMIPDLHRVIGRRVIDPPLAAFEWKATGTRGGSAFERSGCSILELSDEGKVRRAWIYADAPRLLGPSK